LEESESLLLLCATSLKESECNEVLNGSITYYWRLAFLEGTYLLGTAEARSNLSRCRFGRISVPENIEGGWQNVVFNNRYLVIQDITKMGTVRLTGAVEDSLLKGLEHHTRPERECFGMGCLRALKVAFFIDPLPIP